jgi:ribonuclease HII
MAKRDSMPQPTYDLEAEALADGFASVAGVDEAGRGPWAGPVVAAAVVLDSDAIPTGLNDSKALSPARRDALYDDIMASAEVGIAIGTVERIDRDNILNATMWAMSDALSRLAAPPAIALIDGNRQPDACCPCRTIVKGDACSLSIAAASIVAKVYRDRLMQQLDHDHPGYGFARHKGYGTAQHSQALARLGPCPAHRRSFAPVRACLERLAG